MINFLKEYLHKYILLHDQRQQWKIKYEIENIFILIFIGYLCSYTNILSISHFIQRNKNIFQKYELLDEENCPSKSTIYRTLDIISWQEIKTIGKDIYDALPNDIKNDISNPRRISKILDGKFIISSKRGRKRGYNIVTVLDPIANIPLNQYCVTTHDSEKNALPYLVQTLHVDDILSGDAIYCNHKNMLLLNENHINFVFTLKKNNKKLYKLTKYVMNDQDLLLTCDHYEKQTFLDVKNGYVIKRTFEKIDYNSTFDELLDKDECSVGIHSCIKRTIEKYHKRTGKTTKTVNYFVSSLKNMDKIIKVINEHWLIESYHWCLDVVLDEDHCSVTNKNVAMILNIIRKLVLLTMQLPSFQLKGISKTDSLKVNLENIDACIQKLV